MLISVHLPKTAGVSLRKSLEECFGNRLLTDYGDFPINTTPKRRKIKALYNLLCNSMIDFSKIECIHGHFLPLKYLPLAIRYNTNFITWMRDPIERIASHYHYWKREYDPNNAPPLQKKVIMENWSLEKFCFSNELKNLYTQFLWGFPINLFKFIGITEKYEEDFVLLSEFFLKQTTNIRFENMNTTKNNDKYISNKNLRKKLENHHAMDMKLYNYALELRKKRISGNRFTSKQYFD